MAIVKAISEWLIPSSLFFPLNIAPSRILPFAIFSFLDFKKSLLALCDFQIQKNIWLVLGSPGTWSGSDPITSPRLRGRGLVCVCPFFLLAAAQPACSDHLCAWIPSKVGVHGDCPAPYLHVGTDHRHLPGHTPRQGWRWASCTGRSRGAHREPVGQVSGAEAEQQGCGAAGSH